MEGGGAPVQASAPGIQKVQQRCWYEAQKKAALEKVQLSRPQK